MQKQNSSPCWAHIPAGKQSQVPGIAHGGKGHEAEKETTGRGEWGGELATLMGRSGKPFKWRRVSCSEETSNTDIWDQKAPGKGLN